MSVNFHCEALRSKELDFVVVSATLILLILKYSQIKSFIIYII